MTTERVIRTCQTCSSEDAYTLHYGGFAGELPDRHSPENFVCKECRAKIENFVWCEHSYARELENKKAVKTMEEDLKDAVEEPEGFEEVEEVGGSWTDCVKQTGETLDDGHQKKGKRVEQLEAQKADYRRKLMEEVD